MKKVILLMASFIAISVNVISQSSINLRLAKKIQEQNTKPIDVFIQGNIETIKQLTKAGSGTFKYFAGNIAVVNISVLEISKMLTNKDIERIEIPASDFKPLNDSALKNSNVIPVHSGQSPLPQAYDGSGVVIGFIDTGIDFTHPDFQDSLHKSRIKFLWDQNQPNAANTPTPYNYGQEWTNTDIDNGLAAAHSDATSVLPNHGTHAAGVAAGNGLANGHYKGVAPKADIIFVAVNIYSSNAVFVDGVNYIYSKASAMGKPCVINISWETDFYGSHDGKDLQSQLIKNMMTQTTGRALVAAAGNDGAYKYHLGYTVTSDTNFTYFTYQSPNNIYLSIWSDVANFTNVQFSIGVDQLLPVHTVRGRLPFSNITPHLGVLKNDTIYNNGHRIGVMQSYGSQSGGTYNMEYVIQPDSVDYAWRLITTGTGNFDLWNTNMLSVNLPSSSTMPDSVYYKLPDFNKTVVSSFQCLDNVITVANYINRKSYIDYADTLYFNTNFNVGSRQITSSVGPTRDGRIKPDIASPGDVVISAIVLSTAPNWIAAHPEVIDSAGFHIRSGGTSVASPGVAGIAALYLQRYPSSTAIAVRNAITGCAKQDSFTGTVPNNMWGYGKANAFGALTGCSAAGITNFYSTQNSFFIFPNPASNENAVNFSVPDFKQTDKTELKIYNTLGELVKNISIKNENTQVNNSFSAGVYFCTLYVNGKKIIVKKWVIF